MGFTPGNDKAGKKIDWLSETSQEIPWHKHSPEEAQFSMISMKL